MTKREKGQRRDWDALYQLLKEQYAAITVSADGFDSGNTWEAKRLAVAIRVLCHDTNQSHSLLGLLKVKDRMRFRDTSVPLDPNNVLARSGLTVMKIEGGVGGSHVAPLGDERPVPPRLSSFTSWWMTDVVKGPDGTLWSRKQLILTLANKEGGAHVDPIRGDAFDALASETQWVYTDARGEKPFDGSDVLASARQVSYEVARSLEDQFGDRLG